MGDSSSSSSSRQTNKEFTFNNVDYRTSPEEGGIVGGNTNLNLADSSIDGDVAIEKTDYGAVETAGEVAMESLDFAGASQERALEAVARNDKRAAETTRALVNQSLDIVSENAQDEQQQLVKQFKQLFAIAIIGAGGTAAGIAYFRSQE